MSRYRALSRWRFHFSERPLENESPVHTVQHFSTPHFPFLKAYSRKWASCADSTALFDTSSSEIIYQFNLFHTSIHRAEISGLRLHNGMMSSRKNIQKQCPDLRPRNGMMSPPKTPTIIPVSQTFSATVWKLWGALGELWGTSGELWRALGELCGALGDLWRRSRPRATSISSSSPTHPL